MHKQPTTRALILSAGWIATAADSVQACAVCYGDPESAMANGVVAGVFTLVGIVGFVLAGIAGTGVYWIQRSRRLQRSDPTDHPTRQ